MRMGRLARQQLRREWRLPELRMLALALMLAVLALGVVATLTARVERGVLAGAAELIGGDAGLDAPQDIPAAFADEARARGLAVSRDAGFPSVAFAGARNQLLEVRAADAGWPLRGTLTVRDGRGEHAATTPPPGAVYLEHQALVALKLHIGDTVQVGGCELRILAELAREPDGGELVALAPRALMNLEDARRIGLLGSGSRAHHRLLVAGQPGAVQAWLHTLAVHPLPQGAQPITPAQTQERMRSAFDRASAFMRLTALLAALLAGIAIALAAQRYAARKTMEVALLRALGTPRRRVLGLIVATLAWLALPVAIGGAALALLLAQGAWQVAGRFFADVPTTLPLMPALAAAALGLAVLAGFALPPLLRLAEVPPMAVFRASVARRPRRFDALYLLPLTVALALIWSQSGSLRLAGILAAGLIGAAALAALLTLALLWLARRVAPGAHPALRLGLAALARRRMLAIVQTGALTLGLLAVLLLAVVAPALLEGWRRELPADTPNWFVLNLQDDQRERFAVDVARLGGTHLNSLPLAVGKLVAIDGTPVDQRRFADPRAKDWADRQLRLSWTATLPPSNTLVDGRWHGASPAQAEVSIDTMWRDIFGLRIGDTLSFEVGEGRLDARVTSVRQVDWTSFRVNFFLLLDPAHANTLPHTWIASFYLPRGHAPALAALARDYGNLSLIDVDALLDRVREIVDRVGAAVRAVLAFSLLAGALVLAAALTASAAERRHEAALLRTLGARRSQLRAAAVCEFALLGATAGLTAVLGAAATGYWLGRAIFRLEDFMPPLAPLLLDAFIATLAVTLLGLAGTRRIVRTSPMQLLREA